MEKGLREDGDGRGSAMEYEPARAKLAASLTWLHKKLDGPDVLLEPFVAEGSGSELHPELAETLASGELYNRVLCRWLHPSGLPAVGGHWAVIQALARRGLYVVDNEETPVTENDLLELPLHADSHMAMLDSLILACSVERMSVEQAVAATRRISPLTPGRDLPYDLEGAMLLWINKAVKKVKEFEKDKSLGDVPQATFPILHDLKDMHDGRALLMLLHYYCPSVLPLDDICMHEPMTMVDCLYNIRLLQEVCQQHLGVCLLLTPDDVLHCLPALQPNIMDFVADIFWRVAVEPADCVQPLGGVEDPTIDEPVDASDGGVDISDGTDAEQNQRSLPQSISFEISFDDDNNGGSTVRHAPRNGLPRSRSKDGLQRPTRPRVRARNSDLSPGSPLKSAAMKRLQSDEPHSLANGNGKEIRSEDPFKEIGSVGPLQAHRRCHTPTANEGSDGFYLHPGGHGANGTEKNVVDRTSYILNSPFDSPEKAIAAGLPLVPVVSEWDEENKQDPDFGEKFDIDGGSHQRMSPEASPSPSPCPSADSTASSSSGVRLTSFAERKHHKLIGGGETRSSVGSSLRSTPDSSESSFPQTVTTGGTHQGIRSTHNPSSQYTSSLSDGIASDDCTVVPPSRHPISSEVTRLQLKLEQKRRAIETQRRQVEALCAQQRERCGKEAFLHVIKGSKRERPEPQGAGETAMPLPRKGQNREKGETSACFQQKLEKGGHDLVRQESCGGGGGGGGGEDWANPESTEEEYGESVKASEEAHEGVEDGGTSGNSDLGQYSKSIGKLNETLRGLQQEMVRLAHQQDNLLAMRDSQQAMADAEAKLQPKAYDTLPGRRTPSRSPARGALRSRQLAKAKVKRPTELRWSASQLSADSPKPNLARVLRAQPFIDHMPHLRRFSPEQVRLQTKSSIQFGFSEEEDDGDISGETPTDPAPHTRVTARLKSESEEPPTPTQSSSPLDSDSPILLKSLAVNSGKEPGNGEGCPKSESSSARSPHFVGSLAVQVSVEEGKEDTKSSEVSISDVDELNAAEMDTAELEKKFAEGFFFSGGLPPEECERRKAALLQRQQQRKRQLAAEAEQRREEERRRAAENEEKEKKDEEDRARQQKAEWKAEREYIQETFRRRQQEQAWQQRQQPRQPAKGLRPRPKSAQRGDSASVATSPYKPPLGTSMNRFHSVSSLSIASTTVSDPNSSTHDHRSGSVDMLDIDDGSGDSRSGERDWDAVSQISSQVSTGEYSGPKLYKEPSAKSNRHIMHNALSHCCLAGKVNEPIKNKVIEVLDACDANHFLILFRDVGCQYRALYSFIPESESITRLSGVGPKTITPDMVDGLYKYSSSRKQFTAVPARSVSVSMDALTIYNHLWHPRRMSMPTNTSTPRKSGPSKA
uniref:calmodulin-regulated spectrin-associated protein 2-like isoform X2 n=1 Tax=Myxine glutinosa TaxID=7769 RepID=UPI00358EA9C3